MKNRLLLLFIVFILFSAFRADKPVLYKRQNKLFPFLKTFCARFCFINTKQNVHFALSDNMFF